MFDDLINKVLGGLFATFVINAGFLLFIYDEMLRQKSAAIIAYNIFEMLS